MENSVNWLPDWESFPYQFTRPRSIADVNQTSFTKEALMPAIGPITIKDGKSTPVDHVFAPVSATGNIGELANRVAVTAKGFETLRLELAKPTGNRIAYRHNVGLYSPVEATVDGVTQVVRASSGVATLNYSPESSAQERVDLLVMMANTLLSTAVKQMAQNLEPIY